MNQEQLTPLIEKYQKVLDRNPKSLVFAPLAECYRKLGMLKEASLLLRDGIKNHPQYVLGHLGMAELAQEQGNYQLVYTLLKSFKDSHRDNFKLMKLYARACFQLQHFEEALQTYKYILFLNPKDKDAALMIDQLEDQPILKGDIERSNSEKEYFKVNEIESKVSEESDWVEQNFISPAMDEDSSADWQVQSIHHLESSEIRDDFQLAPQDEREFHVAPIVDTREPEYQDDQPFITHTLVDLYIGQGYLEKASELLEKIIELNPDDDNSIEKLSGIRASMVEAGIPGPKRTPGELESTEDEQSEDEGRSKLMRIFDATLSETKFISAVPHKEQLEKKLWVFHERLRDKAQRSQD